MSRLLVAALASALSFSVLAAGPQQAPDLAALLQDTRAKALPILPQVVAAMQTAVKEKGVEGAIPECREKTPRLLQSLRERTGWQIQRVSLKARNAGTGTPDAWEARQLADFDIKVANGAKAEQLENSEIVTGPDGKRYFRYMKALPVGEVCLKCHGPADTLPAGLKTALATNYPADRATGYRLGEVRGALSVRRLVP